MSPYRNGLVAVTPDASSGISPKVLNSAIVALVLYVLSLIVDVDQTAEQLVNVVVPIIVAYMSKPGDVVVPATIATGSASEDVTPET